MMKWLRVLNLTFHAFFLTPLLPTFWESSLHENQYHRQHQKSGPPNPLRRGRLPLEKDIHCGEDGWIAQVIYACRLFQERYEVYSSM